MAPKKNNTELAAPSAPPPSPLVAAILKRVVEKMDSTALFDDLVERAAARLAETIKVDDILEHVLGDVGTLGPTLVGQLAEHLSQSDFK